MITYVIEDELHAEICGEYDSFIKAVSELKRRASIPWNEHPNIAPCVNWAKCGRRYEIIQYETEQKSWTKIQSQQVLDISAQGVSWAEGFPDNKDSNNTSSV